MAEEMTTLSIKKTTHTRLTELGKKGETYDDIINRMMEGYIAFYQGE